MNQNIIVNASVDDYIAKLPDACVDFAFSDPPYNAQKDYGVYKDNLSDADYKHWVGRFISEYRRISANRFAMFVGSRLISLYWSFMPDAHLIVIRKGAISTPQKIYFHQYFGLLSTAKPFRPCYDLWDDLKMPGEGYFFREERFANPGLTSLKLTQRVINYFTREGDTVFDGFMGAGTTAVAAASLGRRYLGCELNPEYIAIAKTRLKGLTEQLEFFHEAPTPEQFKFL